MLFQVISEAVASGGSSLFDNLVIVALIEFVIIKGDAIQGFKEPTVFTAELVCSQHRLQAIFTTIAAYLDVPIPVGERKVGLICKLSHRIGKLLLDEVKPYWQAVSAHLFVKEIKRA